MMGVIIRSIATLLGLLVLAPATVGPASSRSRAGPGPRCRSTARASSTRPRPCPPARLRGRAGGGVPIRRVRGRVVRRRPRLALRGRARRRAARRSGAIDVTQEGATFRVTVRPPSPLPPLSLDVGTEERSRSTACSRSPSTSATAAGGGSASLGRRQLPAEPRLRGDAGAGDRRHRRGGRDRAPTLPRRPAGQIDGFWGANAGTRPPDPPSDAVSANVEGPGFFFGERELEWKIDRFPISPELGELLRQQLDPIRFTPGFFQATPGLSVRF